MPEELRLYQPETPFSSITSNSEEAYRLTVMCGHEAPHWVLLTQSGNLLQVRGVLPHGMFTPAEEVEAVTVSDTQWAEFKALLASESFWGDMAYEERFGCDGDTWILEGQRREDYRDISVWSPSDDDDTAGFRSIGVFLFCLLGIQNYDDLPRSSP